MKGSKDSDSSLISNKNLSEILASSGCAQGQATWSKMAKNTPQLWRQVTHTKPETQNLKTCISLQTRWLAESTESLDSPLAQSTGEFLSCKDLLVNVGKLHQCFSTPSSRKALDEPAGTRGKHACCCCNLSGGVALIMWFTTNGMCVKNKTIIYEARASNSKRDCGHDLYCCLLPQCEALCTCFSGFLIATKWDCD